MAKTTTTLFEYIKSELIHDGKNEFKNVVDGKTQLTFFNDKFAFIQKMMRYDDDVQHVMNTKVFRDYHLPSQVADQFFKKAFMNKFLNRQIGQQTIEAFSAVLIAHTMMHEVEINILANELADFYEGKEIETTTGHDEKHHQDNDHQTSSSASNAGQEDLPQDTFNYDLTKDTMPTASNGSMVRSKAESDDTKTAQDTDDSKSETDKETADADVFDKLHNQWERIFKELDRYCFMQFLG